MSVKSRKLPIDLVPYKNRDGAVIQPGDKILILTNGMGVGRLSKGFYVGSRNNGRNVIVARKSIARKMVHRETGKDYDPSKEPPLVADVRYSPTLRYGSDAYKAAVNEYQRLSSERMIAVRLLRENYVEVKYEVFRTTQLQYNQIFPADYAM